APGQRFERSLFSIDLSRQRLLLFQCGYFFRGLVQFSPCAMGWVPRLLPLLEPIRRQTFRFFAQHGQGSDYGVICFADFSQSVSTVICNLVEDGLAFGWKYGEGSCEIAIGAPSKQDSKAIGSAKKALRIGVLVVTRSPDHEHAVLAVGGLALIDDGEAGRDVV